MNAPAGDDVQISRRRWIVQSVVVPILVALIAAVAGSATTWLPLLVDSIKNRELPDFNGTWTARFKEWCPKGPGCQDADKWIVNTERWNISQTGSRVSASVSTDVISYRTWDLSGRYRSPVLSLTYVDPRPGVESVGAYVLRSDTERDKFRGYWSGYDRDLGTLVTCPLVLSKGAITGEALDADVVLRTWLEQTCVTAPK
jgi:hypothetical protein